MLYPLYLCGYSLGKTLPIRACYFLAELFATLYFVLARKDRKILRENVAVVLGGDVGKDVIDAHVLSILKNFAKYIADFFKTAGMPKEEILDLVKVKNQHYLDEALAEGNGAILFTAHLGNWELGGAVVAALGYPISAIVLEHQNEKVNTFFTRNRSVNDVKGIPVGFAVKRCFKVLRANEVLAIVGDKDFTGGGKQYDFFGRKAVMPKGAAVLSIKTGAPILGCFVIRQPDDTFVVEFTQPVKHEQTGDFDSDVDNFMKDHLLKLLEKYITDYPDQWYIFEETWQQ